MNSQSMKHAVALTMLAIATLWLPSAANSDPAQEEADESTAGPARIVRDHRTTRPAADVNDSATSETVRTVRDHRDAPIGAIELSKSECEALGGKVAALEVCEATGQACMTKDQDGNRHTVCIKTIWDRTKGGGTSELTSSQPEFGKSTAPDNGLASAPLTSQECKGLGGTVGNTNVCSAKDQQACITVDKHGVVRMSCINKVAN